MSGGFAVPHDLPRSRTTSSAEMMEHNYPQGEPDDDVDMAVESDASDEEALYDGTAPFTQTFNPDIILPDKNLSSDDDDDEETVGRQHPGSSRSAFSGPTQPDFIKVVLEFLINEGYKEAAEALCQDTGIDLPKEEIDHLDARVTIRELIEEGRIEEAIIKVEQLCPNLLADHPAVHFLMLQQSLIEMIRNHKTEEALMFSEAHIAGKDDQLTPQQREDLEKTFALLAFENPLESPFGGLLNHTHRQQVSNAVNAAVLGALNKPSRPKIEVLFKMLVFAQQQIHGVTRPDDALPDAANVAALLFGGKTAQPTMPMS